MRMYESKDEITEDRTKRRIIDPRLAAEQFFIAIPSRRNNFSDRENHFLLNNH